MIAECLGTASVAVWVYLLFARGGFWRLRVSESFPLNQTNPAPTVAVIVPARNEADVVGQAIRSLVVQNYPGQFHVFLVDDASTDNTAPLARRAAEEVGRADRLTIVQAQPLADGWTGKLWAMSEGLRQSAPFGADYFLLSDADIVHDPDNVAGLVGRATAGKCDLVSVMAKLSCESLAERALIPAFLFFFFMLYPPQWVSRTDRRTAAAAGGCILIRAEALARVGGVSAIRSELIDDCALARVVKRGGLIWLGLANNVRSVRPYSSWREIEKMISRTAFTQLRHSAALLAGTVAAMLVTFVAPLFLIAVGSWSCGLGLCAWLLMTGAFLPTLHYYRRSPLWTLLLPLVSLFYVGATIHSAVLYWQGRGGAWKGRIQDPAARA
jgi:hopene-associated glycosyltransferase HpnB